MEIITTVDENYCVVSIEFVTKDGHREKITINHEKKES